MVHQYPLNPKIITTKMLSMHYDNSIDLETEDAQPEIVTQYNKTKIGVDLVDQLCEKYNVARNTRRWPMVIFYDFLIISGINALCIYKANHPKEKLSRCEFIDRFAWELIKPQIEARSTISSLPVEVKKRARVLLGQEAILPSSSVPPRLENYVGRCHICPRNRNKSSRRACRKCSKYACKEHMTDIQGFSMKRSHPEYLPK